MINMKNELTRQGEYADAVDDDTDPVPEGETETHMNDDRYMAMPIKVWSFSVSEKGGKCMKNIRMIGRTSKRRSLISR